MDLSAWKAIGISTIDHILVEVSVIMALVVLAKCAPTHKDASAVRLPCFHMAMQAAHTLHTTQCSRLAY